MIVMKTPYDPLVRSDPTPTTNDGGTVGVLTNAFSLNMLPPSVLASGATLRVSELDLEQARQLAVNLPSFVGHEDTAQLFSTLLGREVACNRATVQLGRGQFVLVGQYSGPRLAEGATTLPAGARIRWLRVDVE
jgi:flavin reductase (DIM6/NTAB) family NADH-FMN oxidoreductase RutF